jgi:hypothetical protein
MLRLNADIRAQLRQHKFANVRGADFRLDGNFDDFIRLGRRWEGLGEDPHFGQASSGRRFRRSSDLEYHPATGELRPLGQRSGAQRTAHDKTAGACGNFDREVLQSTVLRSLVDIDFDVYRNVLPAELHGQAWQCRITQVRVEILPGRTLEVTPEGIHCGGTPFSGVHLWGKSNLAGAHSQLFKADGTRVAVTTHEQVLDTTFFLDREMQHYVTPATTDHHQLPAWRQAITISFARPGTAHDFVR